MSPIVVTTSGEPDDSFSFFSPTSSTAAATPTTNDHHHHHRTPAGFRMRRSNSSNSSSGGTPGQAAAAGTTTVPSMELQVDWDPAVLHQDLGHATTVLNHRGLKLAAKWTAEQWMGLPSIVVSSSQEEEEPLPRGWDSSSLSIANTDMTPQDWYAKTLMDVGEYLHAAYVLSAPATTAKAGPNNSNNSSNHRRHHPLDDVLAMPPPSPDSTSFGIYLRAYALYMAGERRKEEEHLELQRYA